MGRFRPRRGQLFKLPRSISAEQRIKHGRDGLRGDIWGAKAVLQAVAVSRRAAHVWLRYAFLFRASSTGARNGWCVPQSQTARSCYDLSFLRRKDFRNPIMSCMRQPTQQANHWPPNHPPRPPGSYQPCIAALEDIICLLFGHSSTALPPGKASPLPVSSPFSFSTPICIFSAYYPPMVRLCSAYGTNMRGF